MSVKKEGTAVWRCSVVIVICVGAAWQAAAQSGQGDDPVTVSRPVIAEQGRYATLSFTVSNVSPRNIAGFSVLARVLEQGRVVGEYGYSRLDLAGTGNMGPGQVLPVELHIAKSQTPAPGERDIRIIVDSVLFEDKTVWGPDTARAANAMRAEIAGARAERRRLQMLLRKFGAARVVDDLSRPDPPGTAW